MFRFSRPTGRRFCRRPDNSSHLRMCAPCANTARTGSAAIFTVVACLFAGTAHVSSAAVAPYPETFTPGDIEEQHYLVKDGGSTFTDGTRHAEPGKFWIYGFPVAPGEHCHLDLTTGDDPTTPLPAIAIAGPDNKPLPVQVERSADGSVHVVWTVPPNWKTGKPILVVISAKPAAVTVKHGRFSVEDPDRNGDGLPDYVARLMTEGLPATMHPVSQIHYGRPYTVSQTLRAVDPGLDLQTDAVFANTADAAIISSWKARGYSVWTMGGPPIGKEYNDQHPEEQQADSQGKALIIDSGPYMSPTPGRIGVERAFFEAALSAGSDGICQEEPEYLARAGYESPFKRAWEQQYHTPWQPPAGSHAVRWKAGQLMAILEANHVSALLQAASQTKPAARRLVALHSPIHYAQWGIVSPPYQITHLPGVQEVVGQVSTDTARTPARYAGVRQDRTLPVAYLEYSSLYQLMRETGKRLWFLADPLEDNSALPLSDYKSHYEQTLIAALLFPDVNAYAVMPWPERIYGHVPADYGAEIENVKAVLQDMHNVQSEPSGALTTDGIGVFVSDAMQWQRAEPDPSDFDGFYGLTLPLLQRGVPVQAVSLDRAAEPGYLRSFKTLMLSYDYQKPVDARTHAALTDWVRRGGSLLFFGGSDAFNDISDSWWRSSGRQTPQDDLWTLLGIPTGGAAMAVAQGTNDDADHAILLKADGPEHDLHNRRAYTLDLTPYTSKTGSVAVRFASANPQNAGGAWVASAELRINGQVVAAFTAGSEIENRFIAADDHSEFNGQARFADGPASWTYQFDKLPAGAHVTLTVDMGNGFLVSAGPAAADYGRTLLAALGNPLTRTVPRLRISSGYTATIYPKLEVDPRTKGADAGQAASPATGPSVLYSLRAGGNPVWMQTIGHGLVMNVGVAPGFFSSSERAASLLRGLAQYAQQRAGGAYHEPGMLRLHRGKYTVIATLGSKAIVEGRTIDLLSPTLAVSEDREIAPHSVALLIDIGDSDDPPHIGFVSGRMQAKLDTGQASVFFTRGPLGTMGCARLHAGNHALAGARATDRLGRPVALQSTVDGGTVLLRYPNSPDGVIVHAAWR